MKVRMPRKWDPLADSFIITKVEIEQQVANDLVRFRTEYNTKYNETPPSPFDVEMVISLLWAFNVVYEEMEQEDDEESLGTLRPETQEIIVDPQCTHQGRLSFTIAHGKTTSKGVASKASKLLKSRRSPSATKSVAGSALSQKHGNSRRRK